MDWRAESTAWIDQIQELAIGPRVLVVGAVCASMLLLFVLLMLASTNKRLRLQLASQGGSEKGTSDAVGMPPARLEAGAIRAPIDRILPRHPLAFYVLALVMAAAFWGLGLALTPSVSNFLQSPEWHIQPFYLVAHLIALRLFIRLLVGNYAAGAAYLVIPPDRVAEGIRRVLGPPGALVAFAIALPFCILDYRYLVSGDYETLSGDQLLQAIDYLMWGIWCTEWLLNAFIWVALVGFLAMSYHALRTYRFRAPIATVVQERHYRPFLQMSSQGATIVLGFAGVTAFYIWYAGGAASDFLGLGVTAALLVGGFIPLWLLLNAKVKRTVREEIEALRRNLPPMTGMEVLGADTSRARAHSVEERLDEVVAMLRAWHLERLQLDLGRSEAQALAVRLAAPVATAGWQLYSNLQGILGKLGGAIGSILSAIARLFA